MISEEFTQSENAAKEKWLADEKYQNLIKDLKKTVSSMRKLNPNDPKMNVVKADCTRIQEHPVWVYLNGVVGISYTIAAAMLSQIDILKIHYVSQIYSYCGISNYNKNVNKSYKVFLKKTLMTNLVNRFITMDSEYALYYYNRIIYLINRDLTQIKNGEMSKEFGNPITTLKQRHTFAHIDNMAKRYMIQKFLRDFYEASRTIMGLPLANGYAQNSGGIVHSGEDMTNWEQFVNVTPEKFKSRRIHTRKQIAVLKSKISYLVENEGYNH